MFGAIFGDIIGSYYETHCTKNYDFPFVRESTFTDDSVMTAAVCRAILANGADITKWQARSRAKEYAAQYRLFYSRFPNAGYGQMFAKWAADKSQRRQKSYGNGGAMRSVPIGYAYNTIEQVMLQAKSSCLSTHAHREAIRGAQAVSGAVFLARQGCSKGDIREFVSRRCGFDLDYTVDDIRPQYSFDSSTGYSVPPAIAAFLDSTDYESAVRNAVSLGGDADTMACIAGGIAEAYYKDIPDHIRKFCMSRLDSAIKSAGIEFLEKYGQY